MARFQYKMQNILNIKNKLENQAKTEFSAAAANVAHQEEVLRQLKQRRMDYEEQAKELMQGKLDIVGIHRCNRAIDVMKDAIRKQAVNVHIAQRNMESARVRLNEVMMERKTHEKLKEKEFEEFRRELESEESKEIDELVSYTYKEKK